MSVSKINGKLAALCLVTILVLGSIGYISSRQAKTITNSIFWVQHTHTVISTIDKLATLTDVYNATTNTGSTLAAPTSKDNSKVIYAQYSQLADLTKYNNEQQENLPALKKYLDNFIHASNTHQRALELSGLEKSLQNIKNLELKLLEQRKAQCDSALTLLNYLFYFLVFIILALGIIIVLKMQVDVFKKKRLAMLQDHNTLINLSNDAIISVDTNFTILTWNLGAENFYGYTSEEAIGKPIFNFVKTKVKDVKRQEMVNALREKGEWHGELVQYNKNGEEINALVSYTSIKNQDGTVKAYTSTRADITLQKKLEAELRMLNAGLEEKVNEKTLEVKEVFERMRKAFLAFDDNLKCTYVNNTVLSYLQCTREEVIGRHINDLFTGIKQTAFYNACFKAMETQEPVTLRELITFFNCWFESSIYPSKDGLSIYVSDITKEKKDEEDLEKNNRLLRVLSSHIENLREEERKAIARELHDDMGQVTAVLKIDINRLKKHLLQNGFNEEQRLNDIILIVDTLMRKIKKLSYELRPDILDNIGLQSALEKHCNDFAIATGITCTFINEMKERRLSQQLETTLFRICQESLTNVMRHAEATETIVYLFEDHDTVTLTVQDNGKGFNVNLLTHSLGLVSMKERAKSIDGQLNITSTKSEGTSVSISVKEKITV